MRYRKLTKQTRVTGKKVIVRIAANVPVSRGVVQRYGSMRLEKLIPTISFLAGKKAKIILISHRGKPQGRRKTSLSLEPVSKKLAKILQKKITFLPHSLHSSVKKAINTMKGGEIVLLENIRFHKEELDNRARFAKSLASLGDLYINEAFADSHRAHASIVSIPLHLPAYAGFQFQDEIETLSNVLHRPKKPLGVVIGGVKIVSKLGAISGLALKAHAIMLGGDIANTLIDKTRFAKLTQKEKKAVLMVRRLDKHGTSIVIPEDVVVKRKRKIIEIPTSQLMPKDTIIDIGSMSSNRLISILKTTNTIVWSGPLGIFETPHGKRSSVIIAKFLAKRRCTTIVGGGETTELIASLGLLKQFTFISTGGGAMLAFLAGDGLPGLTALRT